jgi:hypothetical protein
MCFEELAASEEAKKPHAQHPADRHIEGIGGARRRSMKPVAYTVETANASPAGAIVNLMRNHALVNVGLSVVLLPALSVAVPPAHAHHTAWSVDSSIVKSPLIEPPPDVTTPPSQSVMSPPE